MVPLHTMFVLLLEGNNWAPSWGWGNLHLAAGHQAGSHLVDFRLVNYLLTDSRPEDFPLEGFRPEDCHLVFDLLKVWLWSILGAERSKEWSPIAWLRPFQPQLQSKCAYLWKIRNNQKTAEARSTIDPCSRRDDSDRILDRNPSLTCFSLFLWNPWPFFGRRLPRVAGAWTRSMRFWHAGLQSSQRVIDGQSSVKKGVKKFESELQPAALYALYWNQTI